MKRAALYVRVSTQEQKKHGLSVDSQIVALRQFCAENNMIVAGLYNDAGISARKRYTHRPALLKLIEDCDHGKIDIILFTKLDRWFRSVADYYEVQTQLEKSHVPWRAIWEDYETETSSGVFKVNIMLSVAQSEADRTSERIKSVLEYKKSMNQYVGKPPYGYLRNNEGLLVEDPATSQNVHNIFKWFLSSCSTSYTFRKMRESGMDFSRGGLESILKNEKYCGDLPCITYAYITREEHERILLNRKQYTRTINTKHDYIFTGILRCGYCGCAMNTVVNHLPSGTYYAYSCSGQKKIDHVQTVTISELKLEKIMITCFDDVLSSVNRTRRELRRSQQDVTTQIEKLQKKKQRIIALYEEGDISLEDYKNKRDAVTMEIENLKSLVEPHEDIVLPDNWKDMYSDLDNMRKRSFWRSFIKSIRITRENKATLSEKDMEFI